MLNVDWTCTTDNVTIEILRETGKKHKVDSHTVCASLSLSTGCRSLETFRNKNIEQPTPVQLLQQQPVVVQQQGYNDMSPDDDSD